MAVKGKAFERAVHAFASKLLPNAQVLFDHKRPDVDTGTPRQVDVWIEGHLAGHFPISVHVSCKDHTRKINITQMGTFIDEVRSTGASTGVIYSRRGFSKPAVAKAQRHGISCCRLFENAPADIPEVVWLSQYYCTPTFQLDAPSHAEMRDRRDWGDVFDLVVGDDGETTLDVLDKVYDLSQSSALREVARGRIPGPQSQRVDFRPVDASQPFHLILTTYYLVYRGKMEAHMIDGSYCVSNGGFQGTISGPAIDLRSASPGPGWDRVDATEEMNVAGIVMATRVERLRGLMPDDVRDQTFGRDPDSNQANASTNTR